MLDKLKAVNRCLTAIGESRVNSLSSGLPDAAEAEAVLDEVKDQVLTAGWYENTREGVELTPDLVTKEINIPSTWLEVEASGGQSGIGKITGKVDVNDSQRKLFEVNDQTFKFDSSITVDAVISMEFDDMSFPLKNYISALAAQTFQERTMGSQSLDSFTSRAVSAAWSLLQDAEAEVAENNALTDSAYMREITGRNNRLTWR